MLDIFKLSYYILNWTDEIVTSVLNIQHRHMMLIMKLWKNSRRNIEAQVLKEEYEMKDMSKENNQQFTQIVSMIQQNPQLAQIKPEVLTKKTLE